MINLYNQVPTVYTRASRDFQYICWLMNIVLNSVKHNVDSMSDIRSTKADTRITELLAMTLGFNVKRNYDKTQLAALVSIFPSILKYKGTKKAVVLAAQALLITSGSTGEFNERQHCKVKDGSVLEVTLPNDLVDVTLFTDLMPYILPAGMSCRVIRKNMHTDEFNTYVYHDDILYAKWLYDANIDASGISSVYSTDNNKTEYSRFSNFNIDFDSNKSPNSLDLNAGLLSNAIIPVLDMPLNEISSKNDEENKDVKENSL